MSLRSNVVVSCFPSLPYHDLDAGKTFYDVIKKALEVTLQQLLALKALFERKPGNLLSELTQEVNDLLEFFNCLLRVSNRLPSRILNLVDVIFVPCAV